MENLSKQQTLSTFMKISIGLLSFVTLASISLLFIGDFEGKFERVFSTILLFVVFAVLTAFDTRKDQKNDWYAPVALIANAYILGLLLIVIWVTPYTPYALPFEISWRFVFVIVTVRAVTFALELLLSIGKGKPRSLSVWGQLTSILAVITLILFTAPVGIQAFSLEVPQLYWRFAVAGLILTALGLAITLLLNWYYRPTKVKQAYIPESVGQEPPHYPGYYFDRETWQYYPIAETAAEDTSEEEEDLLPWPTFADGSPYPQLPDGQPDFSVENKTETETTVEGKLPQKSQEES